MSKKPAEYRVTPGALEKMLKKVIVIQPATSIISDSKRTVDDLQDTASQLLEK